MRIASLLAIALVAGCGAAGPEIDSDTDELSDATVSMEMVRANPALARGITPPEGRRVPGRPAPLRESGPGAFRSPLHGEGSFLYTANQLGQFLKLPDPAVHRDDRNGASYSRQPGDLYADDGALRWTDVAQGSLSDCYFAAALSAVLQAGARGSQLIAPRVVSGKVVSWYVTFFQASSRKVRIEVDPDLLHRSAGKVLYMRSADTKAGYEEWAPSLIEKAYARWHGSYNSIGNGGYASDALFALIGKRTRSYDPASTNTASAIESAGKAGRAQVACTYGEHDGVKYEGTDIYADHCYTLRGVKRSGGKTYVQLRNPWGPSPAGDPEPTEPPGDGHPDGLFDLELSRFQKLYASVDIVP